MMKNKIYEILSGDFTASTFVRIGDNRKVSLYVGKDDFGRYAFDFRGCYKPVKISSSDVILVSQLKIGEEFFLRFSLEKVTLLEYFCTFCEDLLTSTSVVCDDETAYNILRSRYFSWKQLFKPNHGLLTEFEIMGLIGELLFLQQYLFAEKGVDVALDCWSGPEKTHKDFSFNNDWYEIKAISFGKESVRISSMEQLDSENNGYLAIYSLEKMSPSYKGVTLNALVNKVLVALKSDQQKDIFMSKLELYGFDFSNEYDNFVYDNRGCCIYEVNQKFPRITRGMILDSIIKVQYEIVLSDIEKHKITSF